MTIATPNAIWYQLAMFCFVMAAVLNDVVLIRSCIVLAYVFLLMEAIFGFPLWPNLAGYPTAIQLDAIVWSAINMFFHLWALTRIALSRRLKKHFHSMEEERLWAFFHAKSGVSRADFIPILESGHWLKASPGAVFATKEYLHIVVEGVVQATVFGLHGPSEENVYPQLTPPPSTSQNLPPHDDDEESHLEVCIPLEGTESSLAKPPIKRKVPSSTKLHLVLTSGAVFDLELLNAISSVGFWNDGFSAVAVTEAKLFAIPLSALFSPHLRSMWSDFIADVVADVANRPWSPLESSSSFVAIAQAENLQTLNWHVVDDNNNNVPLGQDTLQSLAKRIHPHFTPPKEPKVTLGQKILENVKWFFQSIDISPPRGLSHRDVPVVSVESARRLQFKMQSSLGGEYGSLRNV